jgi:hypothetical protein
MKGIIKRSVCAGGLGWLFVLALSWSQTEALTATDIVRQSDELLRGEKSYAVITMHIQRPEWKRTMKMAGWTEGAEKSFITVLEPRKDKGVTFLKVGREAWQYVPSIDRTIKIPPSMMLQSWMGSDFTNDDVVRADSIVVDYTHKITSEDETVWTIAAIPKPKAAVVWGKIVFSITKEHRIMQRADYFDEDDELVKYIESDQVMEVEGRMLPTHMTMHDVTRAGYSTSLTYDELTFHPQMKSDTFSLRNLKR